MPATARTYWRGRYTCPCVIQNVEQLLEPRLRAAGVIKSSLDIFQAGYNAGGVAASAGTHDGGGVLDTAQFSTAALRIKRECGWWAWHRTPAQGFMHHSHDVLGYCPHVSWGAQHQINEGRAGRNGLKGRGRDDGPQVTVPHSWAAASKGSSTPTPKPTPTKGLIMGDVKRFNRSGDRKVGAKWRTLPLDAKGGVSLTAGPADVLAVVHIEATIPKGATLLARFYTVDYKKGSTTKVSVIGRPAAEQLGTSGRTYFSVPYLNWLGKASSGWSRRLRVQLYATGGTVTVHQNHAQVTTN